MTSADTERLFQFFGGYFHQDWHVDAPDADGIITRFIDDHPNRDELASLAALVDAYAASHDDAELERALFVELSCHYLPTVHGLTFRDWLQQVAHRLRAAAAE